MNFLTLEYFLILNQYKSFTKASKHLYITQQSLSSSISSLEKELKTKLFIRTTPLQLTNSGEIFLKYALQINTLHNSMTDEICDMEKETSGNIQIGIAHTRGKVVLPDILYKYNQLYPKIKIQIKESENDNLENLLLDNQVDIIINNPRFKRNNIEYKKIYKENIVFVISKTFKNNININNLSTVPLLLNNKDDIAGRVSQSYIKGIEENIIATSNNLETLLDLCLKGLGGCFCPEILIRNSNYFEKLNIIHLDNNSQYDIYIGFMKNKYLPKYLRHFLELLENELAD